jgi:hypothetical protein
MDGTALFWLLKGALEYGGSPMAKDGHIYKRGDTYWIKYYRDGKPY